MTSLETDAPKNGSYEPQSMMMAMMMGGGMGGGMMGGGMMSGHAPAMGGGHTTAADAAIEVGSIETAEGGVTIAAIWTDREALAGKTVIVSGKVVKYNGGIMGTNWLHIQDGSGSAADGTRHRKGARRHRAPPVGQRRRRPRTDRHQGHRRLLPLHRRLHHLRRLNPDPQKPGRTQPQDPGRRGDPGG